MYRLCWIPTGWNTPERFRGIHHSTSFDTLEQLIEVMRKHTYNGEWVEDNKGNKIDVNLKKVCYN